MCTLDTKVHLILLKRGIQPWWESYLFIKFMIWKLLSPEQSEIFIDSTKRCITQTQTHSSVWLKSYATMNNKSFFLFRDGESISYISCLRWNGPGSPGLWHWNEVYRGITQGEFCFLNSQSVLIKGEENCKIHNFLLLFWFNVSESLYESFQLSNEIYSIFCIYQPCIYSSNQHNKAHQK